MRIFREGEVPPLPDTSFFRFPDPREASGEGIVAVGGNLTPGILLSAYRQGIFPWYSEGDPILWWSPDPRFVLRPGDFHVSATTRKVLRRGTFSFTLDAAFPEVIRKCANAPRPGQRGTWITPEMEAAYIGLHRLGHAHSCEAWSDGRLAGGFYGVRIGRAFFGESMFHEIDNASRAAFTAFALFMFGREIDLVDSQVRTENMERVGAREIDRELYLRELAPLVAGSAGAGDWSVRYPGFPDCDSWRRMLSRG